MNLRIGHQRYTVDSGKFALIKKYTSCQCTKTWTKEEGRAVMYVFMMQDDFIREMIHEFSKGPELESVMENIFLLDENKILRGFFNSLIDYINEGENIDKRLLRLKTKEALLGVLKNAPENIAAFSSCAIPETADLVEFMNHNFTYNVKLETLAQMSGRSLSTFHRDFKKNFGQTPHRWIMQKRLEKARDLLLATNQRPSQIYLELGFEDLAHFSRAFKKEFGKTPTSLRKEK